jgi:hypothetical protein
MRHRGFKYAQKHLGCVRNPLLNKCDNHAMTVHGLINCLNSLLFTIQSYHVLLGLNYVEMQHKSSQWKSKSFQGLEKKCNRADRIGRPCLLFSALSRFGAIDFVPRGHTVNQECCVSLQGVYEKQKEMT